MKDKSINHYQLAFKINIAYNNRNKLVLYERKICMKLNYSLVIDCEVLIEYANEVMAKYEKYLRNENALSCIKSMYDDLCDYNTTILLCKSKEEYLQLLNNIKEYDWIIEHIPVFQTV